MKRPAEKGRARLLRFLAGGAARREAMSGAPAGSGDMLRRADGTRLLTVELAGAIADALARDGAQVCITREGRAWLARHAAKTTTEPFARQHQRRETTALRDGGGARAVVVNRNESPLRRLAQPRRSGASWLEADHVDAGERLMRDFEIGGLRQRVTASWDPTPRRDRGTRTPGADLSDRALDARARLDRAIAVLGRDLAGVAMDICCFGKGVSQVERERCWPPRSAKLMLRTALDLLVDHYGLRAGRRSA